MLLISSCLHLHFEVLVIPPWTALSIQKSRSRAVFITQATESPVQVNDIIK